MPKLKKYALWIIGGLFSGFLLLLIICYFYFTTNKKSILTKITTELGQNMSGEITISDAHFSVFKHFPSIAISLDNLQINDSLISKHKQPLLIAQTVLVRLSMFNLLLGKILPNKITISNASLHLFTDSLGYTNNYLLQRKKTDSSKTLSNKKSIDIKNIQLNNVAVVISDVVKQKLYSFTIYEVEANLDTKDSTQIIHLKTNILINQLSFNLLNGSFATNHIFQGKFDVVVNQKEPSLGFTNIKVQVSKQPFTFSGKFSFTQIPTFTLQVATKQIEYNFARSLVTKTLANAVLIASLEKPFDLSATISGPLNFGDPLVNIQWVVKNNVLHNQFIDFTNCSFGGHYTNEVVVGLPKKDPNSKVVATNFTGNWQGFVFNTTLISINNLTNPILVCNLTSEADVSTFNNILETDAIVAKSGKASLTLNYNGPLKANNQLNTAANGKVVFRNAELLYTPKNIALTNCNGDLSFTENDLLVKQLSCTVEGNNIVMQGSATNLLKLVNTASDKIDLQWSIYTAALNLTPLKKLFATHVPVKKITTKKSTSLKATQINNVLTNSNIYLQLTADKLQFQNFKANQVKATISLLKNEWIFKNIGLQHAGGTMEANGILTMQKTNAIKASVKIGMQKMEIKTVMNSFNNFGLKGITANNLSGSFYCNIAANAILNNDLEPYSKTIDGSINFSLKKGALINFEPIKSLQKFVFKNRDFSSIDFAELKDTITIANELITIKRMEIESTAIRLFVEGVYDVNGPKTDLSIQIPLNNLKKRDSTYIPTNKGNKKGGGASIFIRAKPNKEGNIKFSYDLFKRFRKTKS